ISPTSICLRPISAAHECRRNPERRTKAKTKDSRCRRRRRTSWKDRPPLSLCRLRTTESGKQHCCDLYTRKGRNAGQGVQVTRRWSV
ncbi:hypothetical protein RTBOTA2_000453, partial [Rhodotorula toruloides]